ncbi:hypothetical protein WX45_00443 [Clostridium ljungdahlii DSM 13528]|uniref:Uncharacterized protein n=2 Tax=Clostridium TaxID=1485 RepID=A0A166TN02_9CLOT|nr:Hypothetical protein CLAU_0503 [Clostridium autoethanogenum DSM 10061]OAA85478.1 hypothetical protein WX45_00443 [Clostridium ljungdahlii DSM 13528]OAA93883.1 hypothetical protein WX73_03793 [Clostridium coskatii]OBR95212.1 hypothetical protein CLCOS_15360 [Clostridium coskatii]OVY51678.1 hypothetical protein WX72_01811 [Clostridium autoethanogenum]
MDISYFLDNIKQWVNQNEDIKLLILLMTLEK